MYPALCRPGSGRLEPPLSAVLHEKAPVAVPAWPALLAVQLTLALAFVAVGLTLAPPRALDPAPAIEQRLQALDLPAAEAAVGAALAQLAVPGQLAPGDEAAAEAALEAAAQAAGLSLAGLSWASPRVEGAATRLPFSLQLRGDPYGLPILLSGLARGPLDLRVEAIDAMSAGGHAANLRVDLSFSRPVAPPLDWLAGRLSVAAPGAAAAVPVLEDAGRLAAARAYGAEADRRKQQSLAAAQDAALRLAPALIRLRSEGGRLTWKPGASPRLR